MVLPWWTTKLSIFSTLQGSIPPWHTTKFNFEEYFFKNATGTIQGHKNGCDFFTKLRDRYEERERERERRTRSGTKSPKQVFPLATHECFFPRGATNVTHKEDQRGLTHSLHKGRKKGKGPSPRKSSCWGADGAHWAADTTRGPKCREAG
eukprot:1358953-Amphidinium_carterae.1